MWLLKPVKIMFRNLSSCLDIETNRVPAVQSKYLLLLSISLMSLVGYGQEIKVRGGFVQDEFEIGDNISFWMTATYPSKIELLMPDSLFDFSPFEYSGKDYFESRLLDSTTIFDTAVYTLQCYEIDDLQYLKLPAITLAFGDSTFIYTSVDSIFFKQLVDQVSDTTALKTNLAYADVNRQFNFPMLWIILGVLVVIGIIVILIFGKKIRKKLKLRKLKKDYIKFSDQFEILVREVKNTPSRNTAEAALTYWKIFEEKLDKKPISKLTTKEILQLGYTLELKDSLRSIDSVVYGQNLNEQIYKSFQSIEDFTQHRYSVKVEEINNGK
jgi:hypothetical protein